METSTEISAAIDSRFVTDGTTFLTPAAPVDPRDLTMFKVSHQMYPVAIITLFIIGTLGNSLSLAVLSRERIRSSTSTIILRALAVSDTSVLLAYFLNVVEKFYSNSLSYAVFCKMVMWSMSTFQMISSYLVILMTLERFTAVTFPMKVGQIFTRKMVTVACAAIYFCAMLINTPYFIFCSTTPRGCGLTVDQLPLYIKWNKIDTTIAAYIPETLILILNVLIIVQLTRATIQQKNLSHEGGAKGTKQTEQITTMLLSVSVAYWVLNTPLAIYATAYELMFDYSIPHHYAGSYLMQTICTTLMLTNNCINIFIYCLTGKKFRGEFLLLLGCQQQKKKNCTSSTALTTSTEQVNVSVVG